MDILFNIIIMLMGMIGGQFEKGVRRYGIPGLTMMKAMIDLISVTENKKDKLKYFVFLLLIPILSLGYGMNSFMMSVFKKDWIVRVAYGITLSIPFGLYSIITEPNGFKYIVCLVSLMGAWSIRAGSLGKIGKYDILIEDMIRYGVIGRLIIYMGV